MITKIKFIKTDNNIIIITIITILICACTHCTSIDD